MSIYKPGRPMKYRPEEDKGKKPPHWPGEYRIRDEEGAPKYIGETNDLDRRMKEHMRSGKLGSRDSFEYQCADRRSSSSTRRNHERKKIIQHSPYMNKSNGGEGRIADKKKMIVEDTRMKTYSIQFSYSRDGKSWTGTSKTVKATSDGGAIAQIKSMYLHVKNIRIMSVR